MAGADLLSPRRYRYHQQYLRKNPNGYRCHSNTGVPFPA
jgi:peptide methionine sulfoxide reductase MsrA